MRASFCKPGLIGIYQKYDELVHFLQAKPSVLIYNHHSSLPLCKKPYQQNLPGSKIVRFRRQVHNVGSSVQCHYMEESFSMKR